ncbi:MAG: filamentous hemagglutinin N-terminal domain-containing protein, partial [Rhodobacteraceae bacterium]|nr:filamentous hemagglutinin N-terminal domain-containing protein [Paracoccaceae bacterium]
MTVTSAMIKGSLRKATLGLMAWLTAFGPVMAQGIEVATTPANSSTLNAPKGVPIVNLATPDAGGVSLNQYNSFDVGAGGVVLNNVTQNTGLTQIGGMIAGNPNMVHSGPARIIINEVVANNPSDLNGFIEVGGNRADVIVANPYGITCNGCGFVNTDHATLTTGIPTFAGGTFQGIGVQQGMIIIGQTGANAKGVSQFDLISRAVRLEGPVHGENLRVIAGRNDVLYATGGVTERAGDGSAAPALAIDSTALGGMYAGSITLNSTEDGVGVRAPENIAANAGAMTITADGHLVMRNASAKGTARIESRADSVDLQGNVAASGVSVLAARAVDLATGKFLLSEQEAMVSGQNLRLGDGATLYAKGTLTLAASADLRLGTGARSFSGKDQTIRALTVSAGKDAMLVAGVADAQGTRVAADLSILANSLTLTGGSIRATRDSLINVEQITIDMTGAIDPSAFASGGVTDLRTARLTADASARVSAGGNILLHNDGDLTVSGGGFSSNAAILIKGRTLAVTSDLVAQGRVELLADAGLAQNGNLIGVAGVLVTAKGNAAFAGRIGSNAVIQLAADGHLTNQARLNAASIVLAAKGDLVNSGRIWGDATNPVGAGTVQFTGATIGNSADLYADGTLRLESTGGVIRNSARLASAEGAVVITGKTGFDNQATGRVEALQLAIKAPALLNNGAIIALLAAPSDSRPSFVQLEGSDLTNAGSILSAGDIYGFVSGSITNRAGALIDADKTLTLAGALTGSGASASPGDFASLFNAGRLEAGKTLILSGLGTIDNSGTLYSTGQTSINTGGLFHNSGLVENHGAAGAGSAQVMAVKAGFFDNAGRMNGFDSQLALTAENTFDNGAGHLFSDKGIVIRTDAKLYFGWGSPLPGYGTAGDIYNGASLSIGGVRDDYAGDVVVDAGYELVQNASLSIRADNISIRGAIAASRGDLTLISNGSFINTGIAYGQDSLSIRAGGTIINNGGAAGSGTYVDQIRRDATGQPIYKTTPLLDGAGNPIPETVNDPGPYADAQGNPIYRYQLKRDASGAPIPLLGANNQPLLDSGGQPRFLREKTLDANNNPVPLVLANGEQVTDENGDPVYEYEEVLDGSGAPVPEVDANNQPLVDGNGDILYKLQLKK